MVVQRKGLNPSQWAAQARKLIREDLDNVVLLIGNEGSGKSTVAVQLAKLLDPNLPLENIRFGVADFLEGAKAAPRGSVILADEILINKRKGMWGDTIDLIDFLQICRGMNLHLILCFPHEALMDKQVLDYRVRYKMEVVRRGVVKVYESFTYYSPMGEKMKGWRVIANWKTQENTGSFWEAYLTKKHAIMREREEGEEVSLEVWDIPMLRVWSRENEITTVPEF